MAWTTPTTRVTGELITASIWNVDLTDNLNYLKPYADKVPLLSDGAETVVSNSVAETTVFSGTVPANTLGTNKILVVEMFGSYLNNYGGGPSLSIRFKYGGTTYMTFSQADGGTNATPHIVYYRFFLRGDGATNAQEAHGMTLGFPNPTSINSVSNVGTSAVDSTANQTLSITAQLNIASANLTFTTKGTVVLGPF